jgi:hypothetical protein
MSIQVKCDECRRSFKVKDMYAGQSGFCPYCKASIDVPEKPAEVVLVAEAEVIEVTYVPGGGASGIQRAESAEDGSAGTSSLSLVTRVPKAPCPACNRPNLVGNPHCFYCGVELL